MPYGDVMVTDWPDGGAGGREAPRSPPAGPAAPAPATAHAAAGEQERYRQPGEHDCPADGLGHGKDDDGCAGVTAVAVRHDGHGDVADAYGRRVVPAGAHAYRRPA